MTPEQEQRFRAMAARWYARFPTSAARRSFDTALSLIENGEPEMAFDELPMRLRMNDIPLAPGEYQFLADVIRGFDGPPTTDLLQELRNLVEC